MALGKPIVVTMSVDDIESVERLSSKGVRESEGTKPPAGVDVAIGSLDVVARPIGAEQRGVMPAPRERARKRLDLVSDALLA